MRMADLQRGWAVVGNDGRRLGAVRAVGQHFVLTSRGRSSDLYVPASAIANVRDDVVFLNVPKAVAESMGWEQPPRDEDSPETGRDDDLHRHV
jgi:hypothetical protein